MRLIVYNPKGGAAIRGAMLRAAIRELQSQGPHRLVETEAADMIGPVRRALAANPDVKQVVACGGDGTVAACATAVGDSGVPIAVIPTGTTNVLAFELGLPFLAVNCARVLRGKMRPVLLKTWKVNGTPMLLQLGVGFDGLLLWRTSRRVKRALGFAGVVVNALRLGISFDYPAMTVRGELEDGSTLDAPVTSVMIANCKRYSGPQLLVPSADPTDDLIDAVLLSYQNFGQLARFWISILFPGASHLRLPYVRHARFRRLSITSNGRPVEAHLDGEPIVTTPITIEPFGRVTLLGL